MKHLSLRLSQCIHCPYLSIKRIGQPQISFSCTKDPNVAIDNMFGLPEQCPLPDFGIKSIGPLLYHRKGVSGEVALIDTVRLFLEQNLGIDAEQDRLSVMLDDPEKMLFTIKFEVEF